MFSSLLFLILTLLIVNLAPEAQTTAYSGSPGEALLSGLLLFALVLGVIVLQNWLFLNRGRRLKGSLLLLANMQLLAFFACFHFLLVAHRAYVDVNNPTAFNTILSVVSLGLYFIGLGVFHYSAHRPLTTSVLPVGRWEFTQMQLRFLLPFTIPFVAFELLFDFLEIIPSETVSKALRGEGDPTVQWILLGTILISFVGSMLLFLPPLIQRFWGCELLEESSLKHRLDEVCKRAGFRHGGLKIWTVMNHSVTAAIIGVLPRFRYVMFTEGLLRQMPPEQIEAILAHEIGHSQRKHLLIYPFVIMGMVVVSTLFALIFGDTLFEFVSLRRLSDPGNLWGGIAPMILFLPLAIIAVVYFRLVFGFFSRNFERQADLHVFDLHVHPEHLIGALHGVAVATGGTHKLPNWHHYSIQQRIDFLEACLESPTKVERHHRRVRSIVKMYFTLLILTSALLITAHFPTMPTYHWFRSISESIQEKANGTTRMVAVDRFIAEHELPGNHATLSRVIERNLRDYSTSSIPGVLEFYSAQDLTNEVETVASLQLMKAAWQRFDFNGKDPSVMVDFENATRQIITQALKREEGYAHIEGLLSAMRIAQKQHESPPAHDRPSF